MDRKEALKQYLRAIAGDLIQRHVIARANGTDPIQVLRQHPDVLIGSIVRDLKECGFSVGQEIVGGAIQGLMGAIFGGSRG